MRQLAHTVPLVLVALLASQPLLSDDSSWNQNDSLANCPIEQAPGDVLSCGGGCGNGLCESGESCSNCRSDCGSCPPPPPSPTSCLPMPSGMVAWWPFEETSLSAFEDLLNGNPAYKHGGTSTTSGKVGRAAFFDGYNDYLLVQDSADIDFGSSDFSIVFWARLYNDEIGAMLAKVSSGGIGYEIHTGDWTALFIRDWNDNSPSLTGKNVNADDGQWHLIAFTVDRDRSTGLRFYFDGSLKSTGYPLSSRSSLSNSSDLIIGNYVTLHPNGAWRGRLDELQIYKRALSATEIRNIYNRGSSGVCQPTAPGYCPGGSWCSMDIQCGYTTSYGLLGGCYSNTCICK